MPDTAIQLTVRSLDRETYDAFRRGAAARGITQAEYLRRLVALHDECRAIAADDLHGTALVDQTLRGIGLDTITA